MDHRKLFCTRPRPLFGEKITQFSEDKLRYPLEASEPPTPGKPDLPGDTRNMVHCQAGPSTCSSQFPSGRDATAGGQIPVVPCRCRIAPTCKRSRTRAAQHAAAAVQTRPRSFGIHLYVPKAFL